jgi:hypothetical protein
MKYIAILCALAVACLLTVPAISAANGNASVTNAKGPGGDCGQCCGSGPRGEVTLGNQNHYGQDNTGGNGTGNCAGDGNCYAKGPKGGNAYNKGNCDGSGPKNGKCSENGLKKGDCDGTGPKRDGSCIAAA